MTAPILVITALLLAVQASSDLPRLVLLPDDNAWVVRIVTSGGFTGRGAGNLTASSGGQVMCTLVAGCPDRLVPEETRTFSRLVTMVRIAEPPANQPLPAAGVCADCVTTNMTVQWRDAEGEHVYRYTWDVSTVRTIPDAALRLHDAFIGLASPRPR
jgi:hypothetical protein